MGNRKPTTNSKGTSGGKGWVASSPNSVSASSLRKESFPRKRTSVLRHENARTSSFAATSPSIRSSLKHTPSDEGATYTSHIERDAIGQESSSHVGRTSVIEAPILQQEAADPEALGGLNPEHEVGKPPGIQYELRTIIFCSCASNCLICFLV